MRVSSRAQTRIPGCNEGYEGRGCRLPRVSYSPRAPECWLPRVSHRLSNNELVSLGSLAVATLFAAAFLFRSWRKRRTRPPLYAAMVVLAVAAGAIVVALLGVPYRMVTGTAFIAEMLVILVSARTDRRPR
jgi:fructose-1,6-bisphosphatase/inositol monophosphatase family enzyme